MVEGDGGEAQKATGCAGGRRKHKPPGAFNLCFQAAAREWRARDETRAHLRNAYACRSFFFDFPRPATQRSVVRVESHSRRPMRTLPRRPKPAITAGANTPNAAHDGAAPSPGRMSTEHTRRTRLKTDHAPTKTPSEQRRRTPLKLRRLPAPDWSYKRQAGRKPDAAVMCCSTKAGNDPHAARARLQYRAPTTSGPRPLCFSGARGQRNPSALSWCNRN